MILIQKYKHATKFLIYSIMLSIRYWQQRFFDVEQRRSVCLRGKSRLWAWRLNVWPSKFPECLY